MAGPSVARIDRTSSIDTEPRTLNLQQIQFAREAALYVVNTRSMEDAFQIFTKGMEPVGEVVSHNGLRETEEKYQYQYQYQQHPDQDWLCCSFSFKNASQQLRDVFTAPF